MPRTCCRLLAPVLAVLLACPPLPASAQEPPAPVGEPVEAEPVRLDDPMTFTILTGRGPLGQRRWIQGAGLITADTPAALEELIFRQYGYDLVIALNSQGGDAEAARTMGRVIRGHHLRTTVGFHTFPVEGRSEPVFHATGAICHGACAIAFLGGARRVLHPLASLGFHFRGLAFPDGGPRMPADTGFSSDEYTSLANYFDDMEISVTLLQDLEERTANGAVLILPHQRVRHFNIAEMARLVAPALGGWRISRRPDTPGLRREARLIDRARRPVYAEVTIWCHESGDFQWAIDTVLAGASRRDDTRLRSLTLSLGGARLSRPAGEDQGWHPRENVGFTWYGLSPRTQLAAAAQAGALALAVSGPDGWAGRAELSGGLARPLDQLARDCDAYLARPPASGR